MIETKLLGKTAFGGFPHVLGISDEGKVRKPPSVRFESADGGVRFAQTSYGPPDMDSASIAPMEELIDSLQLIAAEAQILSPRNESAGFDKLNLVVRSDGAIPAGWYATSLVISAEAAGEIREREHDHVEDFTIAYQLSCVALADAIDEMASQVFQGENARTDALAALAKRAPDLAPEHWEDPDAWSRQAAHAYQALSGLSGNRDGRTEAGRAAEYEHKITWHAQAIAPAHEGRPGTLHIVPRIGPRIFEPARLITMNAARAAGRLTYRAAQPVAHGDDADLTVPFAPDQDVKVIEDFTADGRTLTAGTEGTYIAPFVDGGSELVFAFEDPDGSRWSAAFPRAILGHLKPVPRKEPTWVPDATGEEPEEPEPSMPQPAGSGSSSEEEVGTQSADAGPSFEDEEEDPDPLNAFLDPQTLSSLEEDYLQVVRGLDRGTQGGR